MKYVTLSFDDGHELDFKLAMILRTYKVPATFYWSMDNPKHPVMPEDYMKTFIKDYPEMDIQCHGYEHLLLTKVNPREAREEIENAWWWYTDSFGKKPLGYCYPRGYMSRQIANMIKDVGFKYARTIKYQNMLAENMRMYELDGANHLYDGMIVKRSERTLPNVESYFGHSWEIEENDDWDLLRNELWTLKNNGSIFMTNSEIITNYAEGTL